ncbi:MAG TPA: hypothetical protein VF070_18205 [Streptosporangiaceae bacterium]
MLMLVADELDRLTLQRVRPWHRMLAWCRAAALDRALADGADPEENVYLAARAVQLTSAKSRRHLADGLRRALAAGTERSSGRTRPAGGPIWSTRVPVRRASVAAAAAELAALPGYLLAPGPVPAQGVAMVRELLSDGAGPLYRESRYRESRNRGPQYSGSMHHGQGQADLRDAARRAAAALVR